MLHANFNTYNNYVTDSLYQWDKDQDLIISGLNLSVAPEIHFSNANMDRAIVKQSTLNDGVITVRIPNSLLQESLIIKAYIGIYEGSSFNIIESIEIPIIARERPSDYTISDSDEEIYSFNKLENEIANAVNAFDNKVKENNQLLNTRLDNIVAQNNNTNGNSELVDVRVGSDGTVYASAGEAVRYQVGRVEKQSLSTWENATLTADKYINYRDGKEMAFTGLNVITITLYDAKKINYFHTSTYSTVGLAFFDVNNKYISGVHAEGQSVDIPDGAVTCKATVITARDITLVYTLAELLEKNNEIQAELKDCVNDKLSDNIEIISGYYVDYRDGKTETHASLGYVVVNNIVGTKLYYSATVATPDVRGIAFYNSYGMFLAGYRMLATAQILDIPKDTAYIKATVNTTKDIKRIIDIDTVIGYAEKQKSFDILSAFNNILCIGDSLTYSQVYTGVGVQRKAYNTYPEILAKRTGAEVTTLATPGYTSLLWWNDYNEQIIEKDNQLAIIYLGTNLGLTDTLETDAPENTDYTTWAETYTGYYARIIAKCQEKGCKVILVKCFRATGGTNATTVITNSVIEKMADRFGCGLVSPIYLSNKAYHCFSNGGENGNDTLVHYNDLGYSAFTDALIHEIGNMPDAYMQNIIPE